MVRACLDDGRWRLLLYALLMGNAMGETSYGLRVSMRDGMGFDPSPFPAGGYVGA
jgi:hypothetical protein